MSITSIITDVVFARIHQIFEKGILDWLNSFVGLGAEPFNCRESQLLKGFLPLFTHTYSCFMHFQHQLHDL